MENKVSKSLWGYLSEPQRDLITLGFHLIDDVKIEKHFTASDYSFLVFCFAKAYEGFLKQIFLDANYIRDRDFNSNHFRVGKVMSPSMVRRLGRWSVYQKVTNDVGRDLADRIWTTWKDGRNRVFHYYPHNIRSLNLDHAERIITNIVGTMEEAVELIKINKVKSYIKT